MAAFTYKNTSEYELVIVEHGMVAPGQTISSDEPIDNPNLELVKAKEAVKGKEKKTDE